MRQDFLQKQKEFSVGAVQPGNVANMPLHIGSYCFPS